MGDKFIGYFKLIEACEQPGCPVCHCLETDSHRELGALLYEHVNDPETRRRLHHSWGLRNWHTWMLVDAESVATGAAILYEDLLRVCCHRVDRLRDRLPSRFIRFLCWLTGLADDAERRVLPRLVDRYRARARCPVCARLRFTEVHYVMTCVEFAGDPQFDRAYQQSTGLCLPHLLHAVERSPGAPGLAKILDRTLGKWDTLRRDLERFVAKNEYRNTEPISVREADSYRQAFEVLVGRRQLFGTDMHRGSAGVPHIEYPALLPGLNGAGEGGATSLAQRALSDLLAENRRLRQELAAARKTSDTNDSEGRAS